jgi:hypothetical protein
MTKKEKGEQPQQLYRVMTRGPEHLGIAEEHHTKVVAPDSLTAVHLAIEALKLDPTRLDGVAVTLIREDTELAEGKVFDMSHRSRGFGERGAWMPDAPLARRP